MFKIKVIPHSDLKLEVLDEIIKIKSIAWPYSYKEQLDWMKKNLNGSDLHLILQNGNDPVAYLNLISIELTIDSNSYKAFGVGNVCTVEKEKGYGIKLMKLANTLILNRNKIGLLFCKPNLVGFYQKCNWEVIDKTHLKVLFDNRDLETMIYNSYSNFRKISYNGDTF